MKYTSALLAVVLATVANAFQAHQPVSRTNNNALFATRQMPAYNDGTDYAVTHKDIDNILRQNKAYVEAMGQDFFDDLGSKHKPKYMWIGCADARAPANELMGEKPGSVFVIRNVANMVVATDVSLIGALQFAVNVLGVQHIIVCGHYDCGGVRASMGNKDVGDPLEMWLKNARDVYRVHQQELDSIADPEKRHQRFVELNAIEQCVNLFKTGIIQKKRAETYNQPGQPFPIPHVHACVFNPKDGILRNLNVDFSEYLEDLKGIYELYAPEAEAEKVPVAAVAEKSEHEVYPPEKRTRLETIKKFLGM